MRDPHIRVRVGSRAVQNDDRNWVSQVDKREGELSAYCASVSTGPRWPCAPYLIFEYKELAFALISIRSLWSVSKVGLQRMGVRFARWKRVSL